MKLNLKTKSEREFAREHARKMLYHIARAIDEGERLQKLFEKVRDFGMVSTIAHYTGKLREILECDDGEAGLSPLSREMLKTLKKGGSR